MDDQETKQEHYVPQVYLRRFCLSAEHGKPHVNIYDKLSDQIRVNQPLNKVASERYFYDIDLIAYNRKLQEEGKPTLDELFPGFEKIDPQYIEHMFGRGIEGAYETHIGKVIDKLETQGEWWINNCFAITPEEKIFFALWASHQFVRAKSFRETLSKLHQASAKVISEYSNIGIPDDEKVTVSARTDKEAKRAMHIDMIMNTETITHLAEIIYSHSWIFMINRTNRPFITSDNPVFTIPHDFSRGHSGSGLASPKVEVFFPLSPSVAISMLEKHCGLEKYNRRCTSCSDSDMVMKYNYLTLANAYRIIISNSENMSPYQTHMKEHPEYLENKISLTMGGTTYFF